MTDLSWLAASVVGAAPPLVFAVIGETITERVGVVNLSLDGALVLGAMCAFAAAATTGSVALGFLAGALVGACLSGLVAFASVTLGQSQVAVGFVLALLARDLAYVLGNPFSHLPGPQVAAWPIPLLSDLPILGRLFFAHNLLVYASMLTVALVWAWLFRTRSGLRLRVIGEHPEAAFARGVPVVRLRYLYTLIGGALVGIGGASFSLLVKPGWSRPYGIEGTGWIALALVIFGGWRPVRVAIGAYVFVGLQTLATALQDLVPGLPTQLLNVLPFPAMILALLAVGVARADAVQRWIARQPEARRVRMLRWLAAVDSAPPAGLGVISQPK